PEQMKRFDAHVGALDGPLEERPEILAPVRVDLAVDVGFRMVDHVVGVVAMQTGVGLQGIAVHGRARFDVGPDGALQFALLTILQHDGAHGAVSVLAVPIQQAHHGDLADHRLADGYLQTALLVGVHVPRFAADEGFVDFDRARDLLEALVLDGEPQPMQHEPRGLLRHVDVAGDFVAADAVLAVDEHPQRRQPLVQADRAVLENRPDLHGELLFAAPAFPQRASAHPVGRFGSGATARAFGAVRPPERGDERNAGFDIGEVFDRAEQGVWSGVGSHETNIRSWAW